MELDRAFSSGSGDEEFGHDLQLQAHEDFEQDFDSSSDFGGVD